MLLLFRAAERSGTMGHCSANVTLGQGAGSVGLRADGAGLLGGLGELVQGLRVEAGLTQQEVADLAGVSVGGLRDLEQGRVRTPRAGTVRRLTVALGLSGADAEALLRVARDGVADRDAVGIQALGPLLVYVDGVPVGLGSTAQRVVLGVLALSANAPVSVDELVEVVWGARAPSGAVELLQTHVSRLRRRLRPGRDDQDSSRMLVWRPGGYELMVADGQLDVLGFARLVDEARRARAGGDVAGACERYAAAMGLWRGDPLADLPVLRVHPSVVALSRERDAVVVEYADVAGGVGRHDQVLPVLRERTEADPLHEGMHARLMVALAGTGQQASALGVFDQLRRRLGEELGADPGPELSEAQRRVLRGEVTHLAGGGPAPVAAHRQLPPDIADFTGREAELGALRDMLTGAREGAAIVITAIEGMAGVGKTRLAVHLAHQLVTAGQVGDLQLYVDLHGHADRPPADPAAVLASFLRLLGLAPDQIPPDLYGRSAVYRDRLHDKQALVLLDNAADEDQVTPLLPAGPGNVVLITSRRSIALDGTHTLPLDVLRPDDATALLARIAGHHRVVADPAAARRVVDLCGRLPLALALAARRLHARHTWTLADLATRVEAADDRLSELAAGTRQVRAVFDLSYHGLDPATQRLFWLLGLHPGPDFTAESTAALAATTPSRVRQLLDRLVDEHLLTAITATRYRLHDLLRAYAAHLTTDPDQHGTTGEAEQAVQRLLRWYLHTADRARNRLDRIHPARVVLDGDPPPHLPSFTDDAAAFGWLSAEHANLIAAISAAPHHDAHRIAWQLPLLMWPYFERIGDWDDWFSTCQTGLAAARHTHDRLGEAVMLNLLGCAHWELRQFDQSIPYLTQAVAISEASGERETQMRALLNLGGAYCDFESPLEAVTYLTQALKLAEELGEPDRSTLLENLGDAHSQLGQHDEATRYLTLAAETARQHDRPFEVATALQDLGNDRLRAHRPTEAIDHLQQALATYRQLSYPHREAQALELLARAHDAAGQPGHARQCQTQALAIYDRIGHPHAHQLRAAYSAPPSPATNRTEGDSPGP